MRTIADRGEGGSEAKRTSAKKFKPVQLIFKMKHKKKLKNYTKIDQFIVLIVL